MVRSSSVTPPPPPPLTDLSLRASLRDGALQVDALHAAWAGATLDASATLPADVAANALPGALSERYARGRPACTRSSDR